MITKLGFRTFVVHVVAAGWLCASCGEDADSAEEGRSRQAAGAQSPASPPARSHPEGAANPTSSAAGSSESETSAESEVAADPVAQAIGAGADTGDSGAGRTLAPGQDVEARDAEQAQGDQASGFAREPDSETSSPSQDDDGMTCFPLLAHDGDNETPYALGVAQDAYIAFTFAPPWRDTSYAVLFRPIIDNTEVVHHWLLYQDNSPGTPGGAVEELVGAHPDAQLIATWTPGTDPLDFRQVGVDVGLELPSDTTYTLEFHYNSRDAAATDRSGVEVCTSKRKPAHSAGYSWLGYEEWLVPSASWTGTCQPNSDEPIRILAISPHMHYKGRHMKVTLRRADGREEVLHDQDFDFDYQRLYPVDVTLQRGDSVETTCTYSEPSMYGPGVTDEMCYLFTVAYPRGALVSPDLIGGVLHGGTSCFGQ